MLASYSFIQNGVNFDSRSSEMLRSFQARSNENRQRNNSEICRDVTTTFTVEARSADELQFCSSLQQFQ